MLTCPMCKKALAGLDRQCPTCRTDLSLLMDYVEHLDGGLQRAREQARSGELGQAVWSYLSVLEVDPDNQEARRQVSQVAAAVRQFDRAAPGRRWLHRLRRQARFRQWMAAWQQESSLTRWLLGLAVVLLLLAALLAGYLLGYRAGRAPFSEIRTSPIMTAAKDWLDAKPA